MEIRSRTKKRLVDLISDFNSSSKFSILYNILKYQICFFDFIMVWGVVCSCKEGVMSLGKFLEICRQNPGPHALRTPIQLRKRCLKAIMDQTSQVGSNICLKSSEISPKFSKSRPKWCPNQLKSSPEAPKTSLKNRICFYIASGTSPT